nr:uncharacterized protein CI109_006758 [Kwoniella shandongensis]KAA5524887.1 hypothetical protein CI109_006758 [Kwoniella shandongensis]
MSSYFKPQHRSSSGHESTSASTLGRSGGTHSTGRQSGSSRPSRHEHSAPPRSQTSTSHSSAQPPGGYMPSVGISRTQSGNIESAFARRRENKSSRPAPTSQYVRPLDGGGGYLNDEEARDAVVVWDSADDLDLNSPISEGGESPFAEANKMGFSVLEPEIGTAPPMLTDDRLFRPSMNPSGRRSRKEDNRRRN